MVLTKNKCFFRVIPKLILEYRQQFHNEKKEEIPLFESWFLREKKICKYSEPIALSIEHRTAESKHQCSLAFTSTKNGAEKICNE